MEKAPIPSDIMKEAQAKMEMQQRGKRVASMIKVLLEKERCTIVPSLVITPQGNQFRWDIIAQPKEESDV